MDASINQRTVQPAAVVLIAAMLMSIGLVMVASATASLDQPVFATRIWTTALGRQGIFILAGLGIILATAWLSDRILSSPVLRVRMSRVLFVIATLLLAAALIPGLANPHRGSHRWLGLSPLGLAIGFQPSELAKLALVVLLASLLGDRDANPRSFFRAFMPAMGAIAICVALVGKENFGTAVLLAVVAVGVLFMAGCRLHHLLLIGAIGVAGLTVLLYAAPYRLARIAAFRDFWGDPQGAGYQPLQSLVTIASGGWFGAGLGSGIQKYGYLPESHTDFVFAVVCEELGIFGGGLVIGLFCAFVWVGLRTMLAAATPFERLLAFGLAFVVAVQAAMNIAVVTVMTPTTGVPLPMLSAGGSGMFMTCAMVGVLAAVAARGGRSAETERARAS